MDRKYFSARKGAAHLSIDQLYEKLKKLYFFFRDKDYFKENAGITETCLPKGIQHEAGLSLPFELFPIEEWDQAVITEDHIFDAIEFLHDRASKPGKLIPMISENGWQYDDYESYDSNRGRAEFRTKANQFLSSYKSGFEIIADGKIETIGSDGLQYILQADLISYDEVNVDNKVRRAIQIWKRRNATQEDKQQSIRELADVFEWLKKTKNLGLILDSKDESALFELANNFAIRHHNPKQFRNYDANIWYSWIFHFYLATYHASIRLLLRNENSISNGMPKDNR